MPAPDGSISIALDFDGSLVEANVTPLRWRPRAKEFVIGAAAAGVRLWLYSCRCAIACSLPTSSPWEADDFWRSGRVPADAEIGWAMFEEMRGFLDAEGVWLLVTPWTLPGKPFADILADDKAEQPDWARLAAELGIPLAPIFPAGVDSAHAQQGGSAADVRGGPVASTAVPVSASPAGAVEPASPSGAA